MARSDDFVREFRETAGKICRMLRNIGRTAYDIDLVSPEYGATDPFHAEKQELFEQAYNHLVQETWKHAVIYNSYRNRPMVLYRHTQNLSRHGGLAFKGSLMETVFKNLLNENSPYKDNPYYEALIRFIDAAIDKSVVNFPNLDTKTKWEDARKAGYRAYRNSLRPKNG